MGFNQFYNETKNPAQRYYKWSGGIKKEVKLPNGGTAEQVEGALTYYDSTLPEDEQNVRVKLPFNFCILEQTRSITGFSPTPGSKIRYYSNEVVGYEDIFVVSRRDETGSHEILRGRYGDIKPKLPQGARLQINLYIYNPSTKQIERINLNGSALAAFIEMSKKQKNAIYERMCTMESSGETKKNGTVTYMPPVFSLSSNKYSDDEMKVLTEQDRLVVDYMDYRHKQNEACEGEVPVGNFDQTPAYHQGEENQETGGPGEEIDMEAIPF